MAHEFEGGALSLTRLSNPDGEAVWIVTSEVALITPNHLHPKSRTQALGNEGLDVSDVNLKDGGGHVVVLGSPDEIVRVMFGVEPSRPATFTPPVEPDEAEDA